MSADKQPHWQTTGDNDVFVDPLLECLMFLTKLENNPKSADALCSGLPLINNRLTPSLFTRAAKRGGFSSRIVKRNLNKISSLVLPAILILNDEQACILQSIDTETATIITPETHDGQSTLALATLTEAYSGYVIFLQPTYRFDERTPEVFKVSERHWFWGTVAKSWRIYRDVLAASLLINLFALSTPLFVMNVYDRVVPNKALETLWVLAAGVTLIYLFDILMRSLRGYFIDLASKKADVTLSSMIFERVLGIKMENRPKSVGAFANNLRSFESMRDFITSATITAVIDLPFVVIFLLIISVIGGPLVWVPLAVIPVIVAYSAIIQTKLHKEVEKTYRASAQKNATLIECLSSIETIKILGAESAMQRRWEKNTGFLATFGVKSRLLSSSAVNMTVLLQQLASMSVIIVGTYLISNGDLSMGALIACSMLTGRTLAPMAQVANLAAQYHQSKAALTSLNDIMALPIERPDTKTFVQRPNFQGGIDFRGLDFTYPDQSIHALKNISCQIKPGEHVGVIGRIGSGKTTFGKLIMGLYDPTEGAVWLDGTDIRQIDPIHIRHAVGYVPQDIVLFHGTLRQNIIYGAAHVDDTTIMRAADISGVTDFANKHPLGFDMPIGERGEGLSGGQRQAIAIARALLMSPPILVMDEPTNSMDHSTEERFKQKLKTYAEGKTFVIVTHRASLLSLVKRLIVIEDGEIVADGEKEHVLQVLKQGQFSGRKGT